VANVTAHDLVVSALLQLPNGVLVTGSYDKTIKVWDPSNNYTLLNNLTGHSDIVYSLINLSNGMLASGSGDGDIKIWDTNNNYTLVTTIDTGDSQGKLAVMSLVQLSNGILVSGHKDGKIKLWDCNNKFSFVYSLNGHTEDVRSLLQLSNGFLVTGSDKTLVYDPNNNYQTIKIINDPIAVFSLLQLSNGTLVAGGNTGVKELNKQKSKIMFYDFTPSFKILSRETSHTKEIYKVGKLNDSTIISISEDKLCFNEEKNEYDGLQSVKCQNINDNITDILALNKTTFITSYINGTISFWELENFNPYYSRHISEIYKNPARVKNDSYVTRISQLNSGELTVFFQ
jgi:WD40 repeat protein